VTTGIDQIVICAQTDAPRDHVWRALTEEEHITKWWGATSRSTRAPEGA